MNIGLNPLFFTKIHQIKKCCQTYGTFHFQEVAMVIWSQMTIKNGLVNRTNGTDKTSPRERGARSASLRPGIECVIFTHLCPRPFHLVSACFTLFHLRQKFCSRGGVSLSFHLVSPGCTLTGIFRDIPGYFKKNLNRGRQRPKAMKHRTPNIGSADTTVRSFQTFKVPDFPHLGVRCSTLDVRCFRNGPAAPTNLGYEPSHP